MKGIILLLLVFFTLGLINHIGTCVYYTINPTEKILSEKENWSHKRIREYGKITPDLNKSYQKLKQKRVSIEGHYFYKSIILIDTLPDVWLINDL